MIYLEVIRTKWEPGKEILKDATPKEIKEFETFIANRYVELVKERVETQRYRSKWSPLSRAYLQKKREEGWSLKTWEATGQLMKELKVKSNNVVGFDNRKVHKESGERLLSIARKNEYGSFKVPARPLFRLVYSYMKKSIRFFYNEFERGA